MDRLEDGGELAFEAGKKGLAAAFRRERAHLVIGLKKAHLVGPGGG